MALENGSTALEGTPENPENLPPATAEDAASSSGSPAPADEPKNRGGRPKGSRDTRPRRKKGARSARRYDPFAEEVRNEAEAAAAAPAAAPAAPAAAVTPDAVEKPKMQLGEAGARQFCGLLFGVYDSFSGIAAWQIVKNKAPDVYPTACKVMRLAEHERAAIEPALVARLSIVELDPDEVLLLTVGGILAAKLVAVMTLCDPEKGAELARIIEAQTVPEPDQAQAAA